MRKPTHLVGKHGWQMRSDELLAACGFKPTSTLPPAAEGTFQVQGVKITVRPKAGPRRLHRVFAECPSCGTGVPAGRLHQHQGSAACHKRGKREAAAC